MSNEIQIINGDLKYNVSLNPNNRVTLSSIRVLLPQAAGLVYYDNNGVHVLAIDKDEIIIDPAIKSYVVKFNEGKILI